MLLSGGLYTRARTVLSEPPIPESGAQQLYLESLVMQLTGWDNPRERLAQAFARDEFILFCQGIYPVAAGSSERTLLEVLVRHQDEEKHLTAPGAFLPVLEYYDMMPQLDRWVIQRSIEWHRTKAGERPMRFFINVSPRTLADPSLPAFVKDQLGLNRVGADILCFELPEADLLAHGDAIKPVVKSLQAQGCSIAIGSVGRQSVSFKAIQSVAPAYLKIDGGLVRELNRDPVAVAKAGALNRVCQGVGIRTVAEFVEDDETLAKLKTIGVNYAQGFGISRPAPLAEFAS